MANQINGSTPTATANNNSNNIAPIGGVPSISIENARSLLDFSGKLDINLLDAVIDCMYSGQGTQQHVAQQILTTFKEHPDAWTRVDAILEFSKNKETKYYALQILENLIKTRWKVLPEHQCENIKKFIVALIIKTSTNPITNEIDKVYLNKLNMILVQILKQDWPKKWPGFISDICGASKKSEPLCINNMTILKLLRFVNDLLTFLLILSVDLFFTARSFLISLLDS